MHTRFHRQVWAYFLQDSECSVSDYTVHGGLILSITDTMGSLAVATKGQYMVNFWFMSKNLRTDVSRRLVFQLISGPRSVAPQVVQAMYCMSRPN